LVAAVSGKAEVARTSATVEEKGECVQQFLHWSMGSPNIYGRRYRVKPSDGHNIRF